MRQRMYFYNARFPTVAIILLLVGIFWLLNELGILAVNIPWWPIILIVVALSWIINSYTRR